MSRPDSEPRVRRADVPSLYALTPNIESTELQECVASLVRGGARWIQIREKWPSDRELVERLTTVIPELPPGVAVFVNDRIDLAIGVGAHGVHLGDRDLPPDEAAIVRGSRRTIIGVSTHSVDEASRFAELDSVDYVAIGPIFSSATKMVRDALGLGALERARELIEKPIIAIGGIDGSNIGSVLNAGADSAAVISALYGTGTIEDNVKELIDRAGESKCGYI